MTLYLTQLESTPTRTQPFTQFLIMTATGAMVSTRLLHIMTVLHALHIMEYGLPCDDVTEMKVHQKFVVVPFRSCKFTPDRRGYEWNIYSAALWQSFAYLSY